MKKHELDMKVCDVHAGFMQPCVFPAFISRILATFLYPEEPIFEVKVVFVNNINNSHPITIYLVSN